MITIKTVTTAVMTAAAAVVLATSPAAAEEGEGGAQSAQTSTGVEKVTGATGAVTVINGQSGEERVIAQDNRLVFAGRSGKELAISEPFSTSETDWRPTGSINCSWSPDGKFLAVFIPHPRVTVIAVVDLVKQEVLNEFFPEDRQYPSWYGHIFSTRDTPTGWQGDKLSIRTDVVTGTGEKKTMNRVLSVSGNTFQVLATDPKD